MPKVTIEYDSGATRTSTGGCFGFTGRNGNFTSSLQAEGRATNYKYHFDYQWDGMDIQGLNNPSEMLRWICEDSWWSKYISSLDLTDFTTLDVNSNTAKVNIQTDHQGHCIIGTASAIRLLAKQQGAIVPYWNAGRSLGANPMILYLVYYALTGKTNKGWRVTDGKLSINQGNQTTISQGSMDSMGLSDDEVMVLNNINPHHIYSMIDGSFRYKRTTCGLYRDNKRYSEHILNSFCTGNRNNKYNSFGKYLMDRFLFPLTSPTVGRTRTGMGSSTTLTYNHNNSMHPSMLIAIACQLTQEWDQLQEFKGYC